MNAHKTRYARQTKNANIIKNESADKPGSVLCNHLSRIIIANDLKQPTRIQREPR
jgi:hypothetical protein